MRETINAIRHILKNCHIQWITLGSFCRVPENGHEAVGVKAEQFVYLPWKFSISIVDGPPMKAWHAVLIKPRRGGEQA
jgi:hypothetical protein